MEILIDRRAETASRVSVNAPLEFKPDRLLEPREGDCVNLSTGGVSIRTPFVPEVGEDISCRFEFSPAGSGLEVTGRVMWAHEEGERGGRFGMRFTGLDERSLAQIAQALAERSDQGHTRAVSHGERPAQLLLDGVSTPISAHVARRRGRHLTFEQELPLLQIGRGLSADIPGLEPITGRITSVDLRLRGDTPRLIVTIGVTSTETKPSPNMGAVRPRPAYYIVASHFLRGMMERMNALGTPYFAQLRHAIDSLAIASLKGSFGTAFIWTRERLKRVPIPTRRRRTTAAPSDTGIQNITPRRQIPTIVQPRGRRQGVIIGATASVVALLSVYFWSLIETQPQTPSATASRITKTSISSAAQNQRSSSEAATPAPQISTKDVTKTQAPTAPSNAQSPQTDQVFFGAREVKNGRLFSLRMSRAVATLQGIPDQDGFTVIIPGSLSLDRAGTIASTHPLVKRSMIVNKGDHSVLTIGFKQGASPAYRVTGKGALLEILIAAPRSS
jgi:hypothetical protein